MPIGIKAIASYIPEQGVDNLAQGERFGVDSDFINNKLGALFLPRKEQQHDTSDLCTLAIQQLQIQQPDFSSAQVEALVVVTQNGDGHGLPQTATLVQHKAGLPHVMASFDVSLGCSGYVYGLSIIRGLMLAEGMRNALLVTCDPYSKVLDPDDRNTAMLFGDAATVTWLSEQPKLVIGRPLFGSDGSGAEHLQVCNNTLQMNGRQVFNFALQRVPAQIQELLQQRQFGVETIDCFVMHQGSQAIIDGIARRFPYPERFIKDLANTGNTVSSSIPLVLERHVLDSSHQRVIISGFGVGLSWATGLLERYLDYQ